MSGWFVYPKGYGWGWFSEIQFLIGLPISGLSLWELPKIGRPSPISCGSAPGRDPAYLATARDLGVALAARGIGLVYGGARVGCMGAVADATLQAGGEVHGVIPRFLLDRELAHPGLTALHVVEDMHQRKAKMAALSDGYIALPGGAGTLEELFEVWTWAQIGLHGKPCALVDTAGFYQPLVAMIDRMVDDEFVRPRFRDTLIVERDLTALLERIARYEPPRDRFQA